MADLPTIRKCLACKRPVAGHLGRTGIGNCTLSPLKPGEESYLETRNRDNTDNEEKTYKNGEEEVDEEEDGPGGADGGYEEDEGDNHEEVIPEEEAPNSEEDSESDTIDTTKVLVKMVKQMSLMVDRLEKIAGRG